MLRKTRRHSSILPEALKVDPKLTAAMLHPLFLQIWETERVPTEWKNGYLVKLPKKGDLGLCKNWRGIMLLSVPSKVFCRIILERLKHALDRKLRCEQAGFRKDKSCTDHIAALRIIIEQSTEWQTPLYMNFNLSTSKKLSIVLTGTSSGNSWVTMEFHQNLSN